MNELKSFPDEVVDAWNKAIHREYEKRLNETHYEELLTSDDSVNNEEKQ